MNGSITQALAAGLGGVLFAMGLTISGMTNPENVIAFLNLDGAWSPALMVVMATALTVAFVGYRLAAARTTPLFDDEFHAPTSRKIDARLIGGATLFGIGWGMSGFCPGPAIVGAVNLDPRALIFMAALALGVWFHDVVLAPRLQARSDPR